MNDSEQILQCGTYQVNITPDLVEQFERKIYKSILGCWYWVGGCFTSGYGYFWGGSQNIGTHRIAWLIHNGSIPDGMMVLHRCPGGGNRDCVNPAHLYLGTHEDNMSDMAQQGRAACGLNNGKHTHPEKIRRGEDNNWSKLTEDAVRDIRERHAKGERSGLIAKAHGIDRGTVWKIVARKGWTHI